MVESHRPKPPLDVAVAAADANFSQQQQQEQALQHQRRQLHLDDRRLPPPPPLPLLQRPAVLQRHTKTVHFETDLLLSDSAVTMAAAANSASVTSLPDQFDRQVQQLFTFIGTALSAGRDRYFSDHDEDGDSYSTDSDSYDGGYCYGGGGGGDDDDRRSVSDDETVRRSSSYYHCRRRLGAAAVAEPTMFCSSYFYRGSRTISFECDVDRGNPPFRHKHCKKTAGTCNRVFLKKVKLAGYICVMGRRTRMVCGAII